MQTLLVFALVGFGAQLVDGALGMAYGVTSTSLLLVAGRQPGDGQRLRCTWPRSARRWSPVPRTGASATSRRLVRPRHDLGRLRIDRASTRRARTTPAAALEVSDAGCDPSTHVVDGASASRRWRSRSPQVARRGTGGDGAASPRSEQSAAAGRMREPRRRESHSARNWCPRSARPATSRRSSPRRHGRLRAQHTDVADRSMEAHERGPDGGRSIKVRATAPVSRQPRVRPPTRPAPWPAGCGARRGPRRRCSAGSARSFPAG